jgi:hypothetical protein
MIRQSTDEGIQVNLLEQDYPSLLLGKQQPPCLSLYQPTHRQHPDNQQDPIRFRNLIKTLGAALGQRNRMHDVQALVAPLQALADDHGFWNHSLEGLAVLRSPAMFRVYRLQRPDRNSRSWPTASTPNRCCASCNPPTVTRSLR